MRKLQKSRGNTFELHRAKKSEVNKWHNHSMRTVQICKIFPEYDRVHFNTLHATQMALDICYIIRIRKYTYVTFFRGMYRKLCWSFKKKKLLDLSIYNKPNTICMHNFQLFVL